MNELMEQQTYRAQMEALQNDTAGAAPHWLRTLRTAAAARFTELGFPSRTHEEWRSTNIAPIAETLFERGAGKLEAAQAAALPFADLPGHRAVFVDGVFAPELSRVGDLPHGVIVGSLSDILRDNPAAVEPYLAKYAEFDKAAFTALNTAFLSGGAYLSLPRNAVITEPIQILYVFVAIDAPTVSYPRALIVAGENSQATIAETYVQAGQGTVFSNAVTEIVVGENAIVDHYKTTQFGDNSYHVGTLSVELARAANFSSHNMTLDGAIVRHDANAKLAGEGGECTLNGLYIARDRQLVDNHTAIDHAVPHCNSHELYKGILDDRSRGVFNGKIFVRLDAQKTDAKQTNQTLLLSKEATINTKPQLEIFADDVRCTHGATIGQLDDEMLFYLRARGIGREEARGLLTYAFASDVIDRMKFTALRNQIHRALFSHLPSEIRAEE